ncbi:omega-3 polyunsaturated fatty acid synthase subunit, PfaA [uncultured Candidatus Thioglobus sp.]|nr:omega-3 polyunsaturated fatty acid synthase subunit, PfaA [uncultured Candidatus Thioglobus sp.]
MSDIQNPENLLAIVGIGCLLPKANSLAEYWNNIREGVDAITDIPQSHWDPENYFDPDQSTPDMTYARRGGFLNAIDFNPLQYGISPNNIEATDTTQLLAMVVARQALLDAGYATTKEANDGKAFDRDRTSVIMGVTGALELVIPLGARLGHPIWRNALYEAGVDPETAEDVVQRIAESYVPWQENSFPGLLGNVVAGRIANRFDLGGTNCVVDAACASSLSAIHMVALELNAGRCDMAIAGGVDTFNDIFMYMCFSKTPALSPTGDSRPFSTNRDGTILGEGVGAVILKRLQDAQHDKDKIYAVIKGIGSSSDGRGNSIYAPSVTGQVKALQDAYTQANVVPKSIELIEAHGTGTKVGDEVEVNALNSVYSESNSKDTWCAIGSVKSMVGHTKAAAGIAGMIKVIMALKHKVLPPSIKVEQPLKTLEPCTAPLYVNTIKRPWVSNTMHPRRAALSAFGFGGSNFHCVLEEAPNNIHDIEPDWDGHVLIIALGADSVELIDKQLTAIDIKQPWSELRAFAARTCLNFDANQPCRIIMVVERNTDIQTLLQTVQQQLAQRPAENGYQLPDGVYYASGSYTDKIAMIYPGQGAQYVGMLRDLACQFPRFNTMLSTANLLQEGSEHDTRLSDIIYPIPVFSDDAHLAQEKVLRETQNSQPALGVVSMAGFRLLQQFGFQADVAAGHSYGELVALCAADILDETDFHQLSQLRGTLMAQTTTGKDNGSMLAVFATLETIEQLLSKNNIDLTIANHNAPKQIVLSGASENIQQATKLCKSEKIRSVKLPVSGAFHSNFVGHAEAPFADALEKIQLHAGTVKVLSNTTADYYPDSSAPENHQQIKKLLSGQLTRPIKFVEQIERMYSQNVRTFVEIGPGRRLSGLVEAILEGREFQALALDTSSGKRHGLVDLAHLLAKLAVLGKASLEKWDTTHLNLLTAEDEHEKESPMKIRLSGANYVMPRTKRTAKKPNSVKTQQITETDEQKKLRSVHENIITLQKMQEQTAKLHQEYLDGQAASQQVIATLLQQNAPELNIAEITKQQAPAPNLVKPVPQAEPVNTDSFSHILLTIVAEKTGYPLEMLNLDMNLDTDLGIDSIKRVEILAALQERLPQAPIVNPEDMAELQTLQQIIAYLSTTNIEKSIPINETNAPETLNKKQLASTMLAIIAEKTGYPTEMLNLDMNLDTDLGIDSIKRVEILAALQNQFPNIPVGKPEDMTADQTLQQIIDRIYSYKKQTPDGNKIQATHDITDTTNIEETPKTTPLIIHRKIPSVVALQKNAEKISFAENAIFWVTGETSELAQKICASLEQAGVNAKSVALDASPEATLAGLIILMSENPDQEYMQNIFLLIQRVGKTLREAGKSKAAILASITKLGGKFALEGIGDAHPVSGGIAGLIKTADKEWPEITCKAIDIQAHEDLTLLADNIVNECLTTGPVEIGLSYADNSDMQRFTIGLTDLPIDQKKTATPLRAKDVVVVTGGARGVTVEISLALAKKYQTNLLLLGRTKEPSPEATWLKGLTTEEEIKKAILTDQQNKGVKQTMISPRVINSIYRKTLADRDVRNNLDRIKATGVSVMYRVVDVQNTDDVISAINEARKNFGNISGIVHGAGILADKLILDKTEEQFSQVYSTKVAGIYSLLAATKDDPLKIMIMFSSSTARFGRIGQCDYAVANEILNKIAQQQATLRKDCRVVSINWGPWDGGMVTPTLKKLFQSEGIGLIPLAEGANYLMQEIAYQGPVEIVALGTENKTEEPAKETLSSKLSISHTRTLNIADYSFITAHVIQGKAVLPAAMMIEWMAHGAIHSNPGFYYHGCKKFRIFKGIILEADKNLSVDIMTDHGINNAVPVAVELRSENGLHAQAEIILSNQAIHSQTRQNKKITGEYSQANKDIYTSTRLFHGEILQGILSIDGCAPEGIEGKIKTASTPNTWMKEPMRSAWLTDPLALDSSFQMMILWCFEQFGIGSLPTSIGEYWQFHKKFPAENCLININITKHTEHQAVANIEFVDANDQLIASIKDYECTMDPSLEKEFSQNQLLKKS